MNNLEISSAAALKMTILLVHDEELAKDLLNCCSDLHSEFTEGSYDDYRDATDLLAAITQDTSCHGYANEMLDALRDRYPRSRPIITSTTIWTTLAIELMHCFDDLCALSDEGPLNFPTDRDELIAYLTEERMTRLRNEQFLDSSRTLAGAVHYYSDSVTDPVCTAAEAASIINYLTYDSNATGLADWMLSNEANGMLTFCSEGLCTPLLELADKLDPLT